VIKSLIELGHNLELTLTAEGVEDADTLAFLKDLGCDLAQGYHIARPMTGEAAAAWVAARGTPSTAGGSL
jgi:EAL domain-containing protein (putative c-di-GMP-specific phosphodiesterase class I)